MCGQTSEPEIPRNNYVKSRRHIRQSTYQHARVINGHATPKVLEASFEAHIPSHTFFKMSHSTIGGRAGATLSTSANNQHNCLVSNRGVVADVPVLIIGGGPTGLLQAYLLARLGVSCLVVERHLERTDAPKAHALSPRSLEICRQFGLDMGHIRRLGTQRDDARWVNFQTTLSGIPLGRLPYERMDVEVLDATPEMIHNIPQPAFEQYISEELKKQSTVKVWKGISFVSLEQKKGAVTTLLKERSTGDIYEVKSQFVIACDGSRSHVREFLDIKTDHENSSTLKDNATSCSQANVKQTKP